MIMIIDYTQKRKQQGLTTTSHWIRIHIVSHLHNSKYQDPRVKAEGDQEFPIYNCTSQATCSLHELCRPKLGRNQVNTLGQKNNPVTFLPTCLPVVKTEQLPEPSQADGFCYGTKIFRAGQHVFSIAQLISSR
jgi:hypothetical protein